LSERSISAWLDRIADRNTGLLDKMRENPALTRAIVREGSLDHVWREFNAHPHQLWPESEGWTLWLLLGGRGAGKTRAGAEWVRAFVRQRRDARIALISETYADGREVMIDGNSGLSHLGPERERPHYEASRRRLVFPSGAVAYVFSSEDPDGIRGHQFDAAWSDEIGCPAVDKGANAPNVFVDPKSVESALPPYSTGARDDLMQRRTLEAVHDYWRANNEIAAGAPMIETDRLYVYAFDARPYPFFPARADIWGDAPNWEKGHWVNGRLARAPLDALVVALAAEGDVGNVDAGALKGALAGFIVDRPLSPRQMIDPLADVFQFDMVETDTGLRFQPRGAPPALSLGRDALVDEGTAAISITTGQKADAPTAVRLGYIDEGGDYLPAVAEARFPFADDLRETGFELPAVMDEASARARVAALLADASLMRERAVFTLPPSLAMLEPGDAVHVTIGDVARDWRIIQMTDGAARKVEAVRVASAVYEAPLAAGGFKIPATAPQFGKPAFELMNLPLLREDDDETAPSVAVFADPWPGAIALYRGSVLAATLAARAVMGRLETDAPPGFSGRWDARALKVSLSFGTLSSRSEAEVFAGANAAAIETPAGWEVMQFRDATLGADGQWTLQGLLRGQNGTEEEAASGAPAGARFVLLNGAVAQAALPFDLRGLSFDWSAGPADDHPTEATFRIKTFAGTAAGLAPLAPAHLLAVETPAGDLTVSWKRRTRKGGDSWEGEDVPLGEAYERYRVEIYAGADRIRTSETVTTGFIYAAADIAADFPPGAYPAGRPPLTVRVAQLSDRVGPGKWAKVGV
jgi:hypothetical protein